MERQYSRLSTFKDWPMKAGVSALLLAAAGFFYTGIRDHVRCFACNVLIAGWLVGESPIEKHRRESPRCPFICGGDHSNVPFDAVDVIDTSMLSSEFQESVRSMLGRHDGSRDSSASADLKGRPTDSFSTDADPTISSPSDELTFTQPETMQHCQRPLTRETEFSDSSSGRRSLHSEAARLETFVDWPSDNDVSPAELAAAGFYFTNISDRVQCAFCYGVLRNWEEGDIPMDEHRRYFPNCSFLRAVANDSIRTPGTRVNATTFETWSPKHPEYAEEYKRIETFRLWPSQIEQRPKDLANAGFYYTGFADNVKCFYCDGGLRNWDSGEDAWIEHARWFPLCLFVKQTKGQEFIHMIQEGASVRPDVGKTSKQVNVEGKRKEVGDKKATKSPSATRQEAESEVGSEPPIPTLDKLKQEIESLKEQLREGEDLRMCRICMEQEVCMVTLPCGHMVACEACSTQLRHCAICRGRKKKKVPTATLR